MVVEDGGWTSRANIDGADRNPRVSLGEDDIVQPRKLTKLAGESNIGGWIY